MDCEKRFASLIYFKKRELTNENFVSFFIEVLQRTKKKAKKNP